MRFSSGPPCSAGSRESCASTSSRSSSRFLSRGSDAAAGESSSSRVVESRSPACDHEPRIGLAVASGRRKRGEQTPPSVRGTPWSPVGTARRSRSSSRTCLRRYGDDRRDSARHPARRPRQSPVRLRCPRPARPTTGRRGATVAAVPTPRLRAVDEGHDRCRRSAAPRSLPTSRRAAAGRHAITAQRLTSPLVHLVIRH